MRYLSGIIKEAKPPEFVVTVSELGRVWDLHHVLFAAQGSQDSGTMYPGMGDLVLIRSYSPTENYILNALAQKPPRVDTFDAIHIADPIANPPVKVTIRDHGDGIASKDPVNIIAGEVRGKSCRLEVSGGHINIIYTNPGDIDKREGWGYYDLPFMLLDKTWDEGRLAAAYDAFNAANLEDMLGSAIMAYLINLWSGIDQATEFLSSLPIPISLEPTVGVFHGHPIPTADFTPFRVVWRSDD